MSQVTSKTRKATSASKPAAKKSAARKAVVPKVVAPRTLTEFMAQAWEMEIEAAQRYTDFADAMAAYARGAKKFRNALRTLAR